MGVIPSVVPESRITAPVSIQNQFPILMVRRPEANGCPVNNLSIPVTSVSVPNPFLQAFIIRERPQSAVFIVLLSAANISNGKISFALVFVKL